MLVSIKDGIRNTNESIETYLEKHWLRQEQFQNCQDTKCSKQWRILLCVMRRCREDNDDVGVWVKHLKQFDQSAIGFLSIWRFKFSIRIKIMTPYLGGLSNAFGLGSGVNVCISATFYFLTSEVEILCRKIDGNCQHHEGLTIKGFFFQRKQPGIQTPASTIRLALTSNQGQSKADVWREYEV